MSTPKDTHKLWHKLEETLLVLILILMTALTFWNVILRAWYGTSIVWSLEATLYLFAWLVIFGLGYLVRTYAHLGVDAVINLLPDPIRRRLALIVTIICIVYALLLLKGAYDFVANFFNLPMTEGRVIPTGFEEMKPFKLRGYTPVQDIPMPGFLRPIWEGLFLPEGEAPYRKLPINIPYLGLFLGFVWMFVRFVLAFFEIWQGKSDRLIAGHEVEDAVSKLHQKEEL